MSSAINQQDTLLRVEHLCQYFGPTKAVDDVSFDIKRGEVFGLVGESGCGKTTTGRSIIKIYDITSGSIYFEGQRICAGSRVRQRMFCHLPCSFAPCSTICTAARRLSSTAT